MNPTFFKTAVFSMAIAVALGAMGAHYFQTKISHDQLQTFETGVRYQVYHSLALLIVALVFSHLQTGKALWVMRLFFIGILLFCGSVYLLALKDFLGITSWAKILGPVTPLGGLSFISAWLLLAFSIKKQS